MFVKLATNVTNQLWPNSVLQRVLANKILQLKPIIRKMASSEVEKANTTSKTDQKSTIFDKIIAKEIPADIIYEDDHCLAFNDVNPQAPTHFLVIPKRRIAMLDDVETGDKNILGELLLRATELAKKKLPNGYRLVINNGKDGCQSVYHLHIHILGGRQLKWPPVCVAFYSVRLI